MTMWKNENKKEQLRNVFTLL